MDLIKMISVGKQGKCSRCGQEKVIVYNRVDAYSHQETNYCKACFEFEYATVTRADYQDTELNINELHSTNKINGSTKGERYGNI